MVEELRELRINRQLPAKEMVEVVRDIYPKYDKTLQSKCERGDEYGIQIKTRAMDALYTRFDPEKLTKKKKDGHKYTCRISCRLPDDQYLLLQKYTQVDGYKTMQDWLTSQVKKYLTMKGAIQMAKIVGVNFKSNKSGEYGGRTYNYFCELDARVGDIVSVPTNRGDSVAMITEVNVSEDSIAPKILPIMKTITAFAESQEG